MLSLDNIRVFVRAVELGSFSAAGRSMRLSLPFQPSQYLPAFLSSSITFLHALRFCMGRLQVNFPFRIVSNIPRACFHMEMNL